MIIIGYDDHDTAKRCYAQVIELQKDRIVDLTGLAVVTVDSDGESHVDTPTRVVSGSAAGGALWGALFGLLFLVPVAGVVLGGALGALFGVLGKVGIDRSFRDRVQSLLGPGKAAVVIMSGQRTEDKFIDALKPFGGQVLKTSLSHEQEKELADELDTE
ncbi:DUF1269 domain-containing protein [Actinoplanes lobatus]|uniref:Putative membrane protein n=1 Tax=Actinoplanes lobatus TaxID=113568 RepID=A0A7W7HND3_9ACTN|nr:DUF1269 domain-containing protein [Actinoplanes lobatus]MBB4753718.1 putative membrane protein [Actinoplanes lobatus]